MKKGPKDHGPLSVWEMTFLYGATTVSASR